MASSPGDDEYILGLIQQADFWEQALAEAPGDLEKETVLGGIYYELAMYYWSQGLQDKENYALKSKKHLLQVCQGGSREPAVTLKIALLAAFILNNESLAEEYFQNTLKLQADNPEAHFYYGVFLSSRDEVEVALKHWEKVLQLVEKDSPLAAEAQRYLLHYNEADSSGEKQENNSAADR